MCGRRKQWWVPCVAAAVVPFLGCPLRAGESQEAGAETEAAAEFQRPAFDVLRFREDWSDARGLGAASAPDLWDPIKHVSLSDDGSIWASFGGQVRLRLEHWENFDFGGAGTRDDTFLLTRVRAHADVHVGPHLRVFVEGQSALSTDRDLPGGRRTLEVDELDLQNGFVDLRIPVLDDRGTFTARIGRQELLFGKQRLVSPLDWANTRRTFDGVSGILDLEHCTITGFWTRTVPVQKYDFNDQDANADFFGIYATGQTPVEDVKLDLYWLALDRDSAAVPGGGFNGTTGSEQRHTLGGRVFGPAGNSGLDFDVEGAWQTGEVGPQDINAFMVAAEVGYTLADCPATPRLHLGFDYASGDGSPGGDVQTFNQLFPLGHAYFGWIDTVGRQNIIDLTPGLSFTPLERMKVQLVGHLFWRADDSDALYNAGGAVVRPGGASGASEVGSELDLLVKYQFDRHLEAYFGYSHFFAGEFIKDTEGDSDIDFLYLILQYTF